MKLTIIKFLTSGIYLRNLHPPDIPSQLLTPQVWSSYIKNRLVNRMDLHPMETYFRENQVPKDLQLTIYILGAQTHERCIEYIPNDFWDEQLALSIISTGEVTIERIPIPYQTLSVCQLFIRKYRGLYTWPLKSFWAMIPSFYQTEDLLLKLIRNCPDDSKYFFTKLNLDKKFISPLVLIALVRKLGLHCMYGYLEDKYSDHYDENPTKTWYENLLYQVLYNNLNFFYQLHTVRISKHD